MDINCTHTCYYQSEGKCQLRELPATPIAYANHGMDCDCPYYNGQI